jgi:uncharacterized protein (DUF305 family)
MTRTSARLAGALVAGSLVLVGCSDDDGHDRRMDDSMMGSSQDRSSDDPGSEDAPYNDADVTFARDMVPHHRQAIGMAQLAKGRAEDPRVLALAGRIEAAQGPEIDLLIGWLAGWDGGQGMGHGGSGMGGMMSPGDMHALMAASGAEFDRLFLEQMIEHHTGAVEMAETEISAGRNAEAIELAETIRDDQTAEIAEMEQLLTELG